jgi:teichuronic acid biosynthesis glycosyltransferase TuaH
VQVLTAEGNMKNFAVFSISDKFEGFHRNPFLRAIAKRLEQVSGQVTYFKRPRFFLTCKFEYHKIEKIDNIKGYPLYILIPMEIAYKSPLLMALFVRFPILVQVKLISLFSGIKQDAAVFYKPDQYLYLSNLFKGHIYVHYDNYDDDQSYRFSKSPEYMRTLKLCVDNSTYSFATSHSLVDRLQALSLYQHKVKYVPNAISKCFIKDSIPIKYDSQRSIGFVGSIDDSINEVIIERLCVELPDVNVVLVGQVTNRAIQLLSHSCQNLVLLGKLPYDELSNVIGSFSVGMCPYKNSPFNQFRNPLKLYEYCALGIPSVSSRCDFDKKGRELITIVDTDDDFVIAVKQELESAKNETKRSARIAFAKQNTWDIRADAIVTLFDKKQ